MITIDGQSVHPAVAVAYGKLAAAFKSATGKELRVSSGHRTTASQTQLFLSRYRLQASGGGPYGDIRWWQGRRYVRHSPEGTVLAPGTSLHESFRALDVRDTGADAGVTVAGTVRANWLRANASRFLFNPRGYSFGEPWHIEYTGNLTAPAAIELEEIDMATPEEIWGYTLPRRTLEGVNVGPTSAAGALTWAAANAQLARVEVAALKSVVSALAAKQGIDPVKLRADIEAAVAGALENVTVNADIDADDIKQIAESVVTEQAERLLN